MHYHDQAKSEHDQRPDAGQAVKSRLAGIFWTIVWASVLFYSGFSTRGSLDARTIQRLQNSNAEYVGMIKGIILDRQRISVREKLVDKNLNRT